MEVKKTKTASLENKKRSFFLFGFLASLGVVLMAIEWATFDVNYDLPADKIGLLAETQPDIEDIEILRPEPKTPQQSQQEILDTFVIDNKLKPDTMKVRKPTPDPILPDPGALPDTFNFGPKKKPKIITVFKVVEEMPQYGNSSSALFEYLGKKIKYTSFARESGVQGTVYVQFVVEPDGTITNAKVVRGLDPGLDKIALKAIENMGDWNPGKQRGKEVRVQLVIPIKFKLR